MRSLKYIPIFLAVSSFAIMPAIHSENANFSTNTFDTNVIRSDNFNDQSVHAPYPVNPNNEPVAKLTVVEISATEPELSIFSKAIKAAGLVDLLSQKGSYTVFAPTNHAFKKLSTQKMNDLFKPENKEQLKALVLYHVVPNRILKANTLDTENLKTANGRELEVKVSGSTIMVDEARISGREYDGANGVIHEIDTVLFPE